MLKTAAPPPAPYEDDIDLLRYGRFLASHWLILVAGAVLGAAAGLVIAARRPVVYQATATMMVTQPVGATALALSPATSRALLANMTLVSETLKQVQLDRDGLTPQAFVEDHLEIQPVPTTNLLRVSVSLSEPDKARLAAKVLAEKAVELSRRVDEDGAVSARDALKMQADDASQRFDQAQDRLLKAKAAAQVDLLQAQTDARLDRRAQSHRVAGELEGEKARLASMERELARQPPTLDIPRAAGAGLPPRRRDTAPPRDPNDVPPPLDTANPFINPVYGMLQYEVAESRAKVASLEKEHQEVLGATGGPGAVKELSELYRRKMEIARLEADYDVSKRVYSDLATKYEEARGRVVGNSPQLHIVDAPVLPDRPQPRRRPQVAMLGALMGTLLGAIAAVVLNYRRALRPLA